MSQGKGQQLKQESRKAERVKKMKEIYIEKVYEKIGRTWVLKAEHTEKERVLEQLTSVLRARYFNGAAWVKRLTQRNNYDGTYDITAIYDNGYKSVFTISR